MTVCKCFPRAIVWILFASILGGCASINYKEEAKEIVFSVSSTLQGGKKQEGTGFVIAVVENDTYIMTAQHTVAGVEPAIKVKNYYGDVENVATLFRASAKEEYDLALLKVPRRLASSSSKVSDYCLLLPDVNEQNGVDYFTIGYVSGKWTTTELNSMNIQGDQLTFKPSVDGGNSGGPVITGKKIVGLVTDKEKIEGTLATSGDAIKIFLKESGLDKIRNSFKECSILNDLPQIFKNQSPEPEKESEKPPFLKLNQPPEPEKESEKPPILKYSLKLKMSGDGSGEVSGDGMYAQDARVTLSATPSQGSVFVGWSPSPCADNFSMPGHDLTCTASFNPKRYMPPSCEGIRDKIEWEMCQCGKKAQEFLQIAQSLEGEIERKKFDERNVKILQEKYKATEHCRKQEYFQEQFGIWFKEIVDELSPILIHR